MNTLNAVYHLARADFLERVRRYSFLIMLGLVVFLGYQAAIGNVSLQLGDYRGEFNSAWVGSMMAIIASLFLGCLVSISSRVPWRVTGVLAWDRSWRPRP